LLNKKTPIYSMEFVMGWGKFLGVYIFYNSNAELEQYKKQAFYKKQRESS